jgi:hypothetical protein
MYKVLSTIAALLSVIRINARADKEIQVNTSPTIQQKWTIFELHNNYSFKGSKLPANP